MIWNWALLVAVIHQQNRGHANTLTLVTQMKYNAAMMIKHDIAIHYNLTVFQLHAKRQKNLLCLQIKLF